ncbi:hypothetical protein [Prosthecobacter debontii]|uniref:hypothetical protein n=1 Tax=Prosthecobacter debontii TaxID=48467 RepID=UPI0015924B83|nr:hypothetical protein [Prosthecobacter debontii]
MNPALTAPAEYRTDTRATKQAFLCIAEFVVVAFFASALYGGIGWHEALGISV